MNFASVMKFQKLQSDLYSRVPFFTCDQKKSLFRYVYKKNNWICMNISFSSVIRGLDFPLAFNNMKVNHLRFDLKLALRYLKLPAKNLKFICLRILFKEQKMSEQKKNYMLFHVLAGGGEWVEKRLYYAISRVNLHYF